MELITVTQAVYATVGIDTETILNEYHTNWMVERGFDPVVAFELRHCWDIEVDSNCFKQSELDELFTDIFGESPAEYEARLLELELPDDYEF